MAKTMIMLRHEYNTIIYL